MRWLGCAALLILAASEGWPQLLSPVWIEAGEDGAALARVVVRSAEDCPSIIIDGVSSRMALRSPVPQGFAPACEAAIRKNDRTASVNGRALALPKANPSRIAVFGDTGCRINANEVQDCNDPAQWPFLRVTRLVTAAKPDLVIHVGDFLYREVPCPADKQSFCAGTPAGDNWEAWNADFFTPAAPLLAAAPWVFTRGNHENCQRSWRGWFYYLDPHTWRGDVCEPLQPPYLVRLGSFRLIEFDSSAAGDSMDESQIASFTAALASLHTDRAWLASHHPFWGFRTRGDVVQAAVPGLTQAWRRAAPQGIDLLLSGHVHLFELLGFDHNLPAQIVAGDGGTNLSTPIGAPLPGMRLEDAKVLTGITERRFGYTLLTRSTGAWRLTLNGEGGRVLANCTIRGHEVACQK